MNTNEYVEFIMKDSLNRYAVKNSKVKNINFMNEDIKKGKVAATFSKEDLSNFGVKGIIYGSIEKLVSRGESITHWTPNPYRYLSYNNDKRITNHTKDNIKQINTFVIDIDKDYEQNMLVELLISANIDNQVPFPNLYVKSPRGWHLYYVLDKPLYINKQKRSLYVAERVQRNILNALSEYIDVDLNCVPFGFYRFPTEENVKYFNRECVSKDDIIKWSTNYSNNNKERSKALFTAINTSRPAWVTTLLNMKNITPKSGYNACRNNTVFTLALYFYSVNKNYEETFNILDEFNSNLNTPLNTNEFRGVIESAFSGKYNAPSNAAITNILETWTNQKVDVNDRYFKVFYKFKKDRKERVRSHYDERIQDIISYLEQNTDTEKLFIEGSIKEILAQFNMPKSSFYDVLNTLEDKNIISKFTSGKGRYSKTKIALFKNILKKFYITMIEMKIVKERYVDYLESILTSILNIDDEQKKQESYKELLEKMQRILSEKHKSNERIIEENRLII